MDLITREDIRRLAETGGPGPVISIYLPTHPVSTERDQDLVLFKNLVKKVEEGLLAGGMRSANVSTLMLPVRTLQNNPMFWRQSTGGLAVLNSEAGFSTLRLPGPAGPSAMVADRFVLKPLLPFVDHGEAFYVLALSLNSVRLFHGSRFNVTEVPLEDIPTSLADALKWDDYEREVQFFSTAMGTVASQTFYGTASAGENHKDEVARYFRGVDDGLREMLAEKPVPVVLAGVDYLLPIYRSASRYPALADGGVPGNPEHVTNAQLHRRAWNLVEPRLNASRSRAIERFGELAAAGKASSDLTAIVPAALSGRVETLFLDMGVTAWGQPGVNGSAPTVHDTPEPGDTDLWDLSATRTMLTGGAVWAVDPVAEPDLAPAAAVFRY
jgi:hypothetical protein